MMARLHDNGLQHLVLGCDEVFSGSAGSEGVS